MGGTHLSFKVLANEREGIIERLHGSKLDIRRGLLLPCAMNHRGQNLVRAHGQHIRVLGNGVEWTSKMFVNKGRTSASQMKPIALSVDCRKGTLVPVLTKRRRISIRSGH